MRRELFDLQQRKKDAFNRLLKVSNDAVSGLLEKEIERLDKETEAKREQLVSSPGIVLPLDELVGTALTFLEKPQEIWLNGDYEDKRTVLHSPLLENYDMVKKQGMEPPIIRCHTRF